MGLRFFERKLKVIVDNLKEIFISIDDEVQKEVKRLMTKSTKSNTDKVYVDNLLGMSREKFIDSSYIAFLKRPADPKGTMHWMREMRVQNLTKIEVLARIRYSSEGRKVGVKLPFLLHVKLLLALASGLPVVGYCLTFLFVLITLPKLKKHLLCVSDDLSDVHSSLRDVSTGLHEFKRSWLMQEDKAESDYWKEISRQIPVIEEKLDVLTDSFDTFKSVWFSK